MSVTLTAPVNLWKKFLHMWKTLIKFGYKAMHEAVQNSTEPDINVSELDERRWSVISFERCEGSGLGYDEAARLLAELDSRKVAGLCIVADEAAARIA